MSNRGVTVTVKCSGCYDYLGDYDTEEYLEEPIIEIDPREFQYHHKCEKDKGKEPSRWCQAEEVVPDFEDTSTMPYSGWKVAPCHRATVPGTDYCEYHQNETEK